MKRTLFTPIFLAVWMISGQLIAQDFSQSFETHSTRAEYSSRFNFLFSSFNTSISPIIAGTRSIYSGTLSSATTGQNVFFQTGWLNITAGDSILFNHKPTSMSSSPFITVKLVAIDGTVSAPIFTHTYANPNLVSSLLVINVSGWYKIRFIGNGTAGSSRLLVDDLTSTIAGFEAGNSCFLSDLKMTATTNKTTYASGESVFLSLKIRNNGVDLAANYKSNFAIPAGFTIINTTSSANCTTNLSLSEITIPTLAVNDSATVLIEMTSTSAGTYAASLNAIGFNNTDTKVEVDHNTANDSEVVSFSIQAALPVELSDFRAIESAENMVELVWATESECNFGRFVLERASNGRNFYQIHSETAQIGCRNDHQEYQAFDQKPLVGANYYRLRMEDLDGSVEFSNIISVNIEPTETRHPIFQTVAISEFSILNAAELSGDLRIFDTSGHLVFSDKIENLTESISVNAWQSGIYFVQLLDGNQIWTGRMMKK